MSDPQGSIFYWILHQPSATALAVFVIGLLYTLQGFRFARFLLAITCGMGGFLGGAIAAAIAGVPSLPIAAGAGVLLFLIALARFRIGITLASSFVFAVLGFYLARRFVLDPGILLISLALGGALGLSLKWLYFRILPILVTTLQGAMLMIIGFVGLASDAVPSLAQTFVDWSGQIPLMIPVLLLMLCVLGYSVQANAQQGDMTTGGGRGWNSVEAN